ncbi:MAG: dTMP kinase [Candidatus Omnitrophota bacterium]
MKHKRGFFITFEGAEGSGKSTQIKRAADDLRRRGLKVLVLREPGGTRIGESLRTVILNRHFREMNPKTELLLYLAARAQLIHERILPALREGTVVICDRFEDSTLAYQGYGRGLPVRDILEISRKWVRGARVPDLTILLDIAPADGMKRGGRSDRMELEAMAFHERVRRGFLRLAKKNPKRYRVIDSRRDIETVARAVREVLEHAVR